MNIKKYILVLALIVQVRCDCDDYFKCLSSFVSDIFGSKVDRSDVNDTEIINVVSLKNKTVNVFDLSDVGRSLSEALTDVTTLIKEEIKGVFNIEDEQNVHKDIDNKTEIHVRAFSLSKANGSDTKVNIPEVIINNFTKFNDELNSLKVEIENNLQAELEAFISNILENDTVDWVEITESSLTDTEFTTTVEPYPYFKDNVESTTQTLDNNIDDVNIDFSNNEANEALLSVEVTTKKSIEYKNEFSSKITAKNNTTDIRYDSTKLADFNTTTPTTITTVKPEVTSTTKYNENSTKADVVTRTTVLPNTINLNESTTKIVTTTVKPTIKLTPETDKTTVQLLTEKSNEFIEVNVIKQETQTKTPKNYKIQENIKENEISNDDPSYYEIQDDNVTDYPIIDYVDLYKDTTNEEIEYVPTTIANEIKSDFENVIQKEDGSANNGYYTNDTTSPYSILPWVAAIFIKNGANNQFDYYCDGILLSDTVVLTAARCLYQGNTTVSADDVIIFLGKRSLQASTDGETINKVKQLRLHSNFSLHGEVAQNDLALLYLEAPAVFSEGIQPACLVEGEGDEAVTTAWGEGLSLIKFVEKNQTCERDSAEGVFCATYGLTVALCPSYGGVYAVQQGDKWCAGGVRTADPSNRGLCFDKTVSYTNLSAHRTWIDMK